MAVLMARKVPLYVAVTLASSWLFMALQLAYVSMFMPMVVAILIQWSHKEPIREPLGISLKLNPWIALAWFLPPVLALAVFGVSLLIPSVEFSPDMSGFDEKFSSPLTSDWISTIRESGESTGIHPIWIVFIRTLYDTFNIYALPAFLEEVGWRGFLQRQLAPVGFWRSSFVIGIIWGIWHVPFILLGYKYPGHPLEGVMSTVVGSILLSPIFAYVRIKGRSIVAATVIHASFNSSIVLSIVMLKGGSDLLTGLGGTAGFIVLLMVNLCIYIYDRYVAKYSIFSASSRGAPVSQFKTG